MIIVVGLHKVAISLKECVIEYADLCLKFNFDESHATFHLRKRQKNFLNETIRPILLTNQLLFVLTTHKKCTNENAHKSNST